MFAQAQWTGHSVMRMVVFDSDARDCVVCERGVVTREVAMTCFRAMSKKRRSHSNEYSLRSCHYAWSA